MILPNMPQVYLKTTETCNLNCKHCFTSGRSGRKIFFDVDKTLNFFARLAKECSWIKGVHFIYHGGEPMIAPLEDLERFRKNVIEVLPESKFSLQTNLVYKLTPSIKKFLSSLGSFGISWDHDIRFENDAQRTLWGNNVKELSHEGLNLTMVVSMSNNLIREKKGIDIVAFAHLLGFKHILFERITSNGSAVINTEVIPSNLMTDAWTYDMYQDTMKGKWYEKIDNMLLSTIAEGIINLNNVATSCRNCEQKLFTINADGTIAGCPNSAPNEKWGDISMGVFDIFKSSARMKAVMCEATKNPICYSCEHLPVCNGGCHRLDWQGITCPAPKKLFSLGAREPEAFKELLW